MSLAPAANVSVAAAIGGLAVAAVHIAQANGIIVPPDVADAIPGLIVVLVAYLHDCFTGGNKPAS